jgi:hypothetical protein
MHGKDGIVVCFYKTRDGTKAFTKRGCKKSNGFKKLEILRTFSYGTNMEISLSLSLISACMDLALERRNSDFFLSKGSFWVQVKRKKIPFFQIKIIT